MSDKVKIEELLMKKYSDDTIMLIATSKDNIPTVRSVDCFYYEGSFWVVTDLRCNYVKEIQANENVMVSDGGHNRFWCKGEVVGHPLEEKNLSIREVYKKVFNNWYEEVNNEALDSVCFVRAQILKGYIHNDSIGHNFDFEKEVFSTGKVTHHIDVELKPFF